MKARHIILPLVAALAMGVILVGDAQAAKPTPTTPPPPPPPPNQVIAFGGTFGTRKQAVSGVWKMNADGSNVTLVYRDWTRPIWSPDGSQLAVHLRPELRRINADGSNPVVLATDVGAPLSKTHSWSPTTDSGSPAYNLIAYASWDGYGYSLAVVDSEGSRRTVLLQQTYSTDPVSGCEYAYPEWSRDASSIAALRHCRAGSTHEYAIIVVPLANPLGNYVLYGPSSSMYFAPRWARQRDALIFGTTIDGVAGAYVLELQADATGVYSPSGPPTLIGTDIGHPFAWSPDDSKLVFSGVYTHEFATGNRTFLASGSAPDWKP